MKLKLGSFTWTTLGYNVFVILWGAWVRASGSGAGCGDHWPLCNGEVVPRDPSIQTLIELGHRTTSGLALILVLILAIWAARALKKGHPGRFWTSCSVVLIFLEALIGAGLVLWKLVGEDSSAARATIIGLHLVNTLLLLGALSRAAFFLSQKKIKKKKAHPQDEKWFILGALGFGLIGASGAITALGDTLYPASSLAAGIKMDLEPGAHFLIRLRVLHPIFALIVGTYLFALPLYFDYVGRLKRVLPSLILVGWTIGVINLGLLAPISVQLLHLLVADVTWIVLMWITCDHQWGANAE